MANREHLAILGRGVGAWNEWGKSHRDVKPDLSEANLSEANLRWAILSGVDLSGANLTGADLGGADLRSANLRSANHIVADLTEGNLMGADLTEADLREADLFVADLITVNLHGANLSQIDFTHANLTKANLTKANLTKANLTMANLTLADLSEANLLAADLTGTIFDQCSLNSTELSGCIVCETSFNDCDLSTAKRLKKTNHTSPSSIGIDTIYRSNGQIPDEFLRDAGVPEEIIDIARTIRSGPPIQWHSCFISYSTKNEEFARRLHSRMREANLRVWFAPEDVAGGKKLHEQLFEAIQLQDKLLLVLSNASIQSEWVMTEIRRAREIEKREKRRKLFPIRLADFDTLRGWECFDSDRGKDLAVEVREYYIPDFSNWKDQDAFEESFNRLLKDLKADGGG